MSVVSQIQLFSGVTGKLCENFYPEVLNGILMDDFSNMPTPQSAYLSSQCKVGLSVGCVCCWVVAKAMNDWENMTQQLCGRCTGGHSIAVVVVGKVGEV